MRNKVAKRLRKEAKKETVGQSTQATRKIYQAKKREYKAK
jgi:hypothetical protein